MKNVLIVAALGLAMSSAAWADDAAGHAGSEHPANAVQGKKPANIVGKPALPPGVHPADHKVHAGYEHPAVEGHDHPPPLATENKPALPPGVEPSHHKVHAGYEHPAVEGHDHRPPSATEAKPALPPGVKP